MYLLLDGNDEDTGHHFDNRREAEMALLHSPEDWYISDSTYLPVGEIKDYEDYFDEADYWDGDESSKSLE